MSVKIVTDRLQESLKIIRRLTDKQVYVGIPDEKAGRRDGPASNAVIGYVHEFGKPDMNIPARPFLIPGIKSVEDKIAKRMGAGAKKALAGDKEAVTKVLTSVGITAENAVKKVINSGEFAPLSERTLYQRKNRKKAPRTSEKPLIDTGQLRKSITHVIGSKGRGER
ncbi:phage gpG-like protein [Pseudochelatococcus contaminans]|uniref:Phage gpG-like protein n=2 Tax=Pseudochelatococcus contaminans TaxID=1538103 RepID=A0A7W5Z2S4_9HYPH|nr:phage gpG-like protein [Pseudochelatococcus contaminans]